jgi:hypothetical protein
MWTYFYDFILYKTVWNCYRKNSNDDSDLICIVALRLWRTPFDKYTIIIFICKKAET